MLNPPGVRMIANEIQNPPYDERAVAPKVLPTAISLLGMSVRSSSSSLTWNSPHASKELHQTTIGKRGANDNAWLSDAPGMPVDQRQEESGERKSR